MTPTITKTPTRTPTFTRTPTRTNTPTITKTPYKTITITNTPTKVKTLSPTPTVIVCDANLLQNGSFELPLVSGQNIPYWTEKPNGSITIGSGYQADGSYGAFIGPNEQLYQAVNATAGNQYIVTFWAGTHDPLQNEKVNLEFLNSSNNVIAKQSVDIDYDVDNDHTPPRVTQYKLQGIAPSDAVKVRVIAINNGRNTFKFDAVCLTGTKPTITPTNTPPTNTPVVPTATSTHTPKHKPDVPSDSSINTPTNTPVVPKATAINTPTNTPAVPTATSTNTPTNTPAVPTATSTNTLTNTPAN
jgi:hypothetical protein